jgi:xylulokinase
MPVTVPMAGEYVALGAARQAAWALTGELPHWPRAGAVEYTAEPETALRRRYAVLRDATAGWREKLD